MLETNVQHGVVFVRHWYLLDIRCLTMVFVRHSMFNKAVDKNFPRD